MTYKTLCPLFHCYISDLISYHSPSYAFSIYTVYHQGLCTLCPVKFWFFSQRSTWFPPSAPAVLSSSVTLSERPCLANLFEKTPPPLPQ